MPGSWKLEKATWKNVKREESVFTETPIGQGDDDSIGCSHLSLLIELGMDLLRVANVLWTNLDKTNFIKYNKFY